MSRDKIQALQLSNIPFFTIFTHLYPPVLENSDSSSIWPSQGLEYSDKWQNLHPPGFATICQGLYFSLLATQSGQSRVGVQIADLSENFRNLFTRRWKTFGDDKFKKWRKYSIIARLMKKISN